MIRTLRNLLILSAVFFVIAVFPVKAEQRDYGSSEPKLEAAPEQMVPKSWWLAERRKRKRALKIAVKMERARNHARAALRYVVKHPPYGKSSEEAALLCIHFNPRVGHGEGAWDAHTGNGYDGGLQMDRSFQNSYGRTFVNLFGPAWTWPVSVQLAVGITAVRSGRGYTPWPNTARSCGLL